MIGFTRSKSPSRIWLARSLAVAADVLQVAVFPAFITGAISPFEDGLDLMMAAILTFLVGWHIAFFPSFIVKLLPVADLAPTWTIAVFIATRRASAESRADERPALEFEKPPKRWKAWYDHLVKPNWTPSPATISTIWTTLYPIIFLTFGFVFVQAIRGKVPLLLTLPFAVNLVANLIFTPILFGLRNLWLATADILIVLGTIIWAIITVWPLYPTIAVAQIPYLLWVSIATVLQISIAFSNRS